VNSSNNGSSGNNDNSSNEEKKKENMTEEEKLSVAMEKRGRRLPDVKKRTELVTTAHARGHFGEKAMLSYIDREGYWWPKLRADIANEINECPDCQRFSAYTFGYEPARSISASLPGDHLQIDLAQLPQSSEGYNYILVVVDLFSSFVLLRPMKDKQGITAANALWDIICTIGPPKILQSDNGSEFRNQITNTLCRLTGIPQHFISAYNPRSDGKVERTVKTIKQTIVKLLKGAISLWPTFVPFVQLMYNTKVQELTGSSPFSLMFGRKVNELKDYSNTPAQPITTENWIEHQRKIASLIMPSINNRINDKKTKQRLALDKTRKKLLSEALLPGSIVMIVDSTYLANPSLRPSTQPKFVGPYTVVRNTLGGYLLHDSTSTALPRAVHIDQMKVLFRAGERAPPKALLDGVEGEETFEIDEILDDRNEENEEQEYLVKWKGYDESEATWEVIENFDDYKCVETYWKKKIEKEHNRIKKKGKAPTVRHIIYEHHA